MRSYHFSIVKKGIVVEWPWLFRRYILLELSVIVIYPFIFIPVKDKYITDRFSLSGMMNIIFLKQQEEILQLLLLFLIAGFVITGINCFWILLIPIAYFLVTMLFIYDKHKKSITYLTKPFGLAFMLMQTPMYKEAYSNCNYPDYFRVRKVFGWRKYLYH